MRDPRFFDNYTYYTQKKSLVLEQSAHYQNQELETALVKWWQGLWQNPVSCEEPAASEQELRESLSDNPLPDELKLPFKQKLFGRSQRESALDFVAADLLLDTAVKALVQQEPSLELFTSVRQSIYWIDSLYDYSFVERFSKALLSGAKPAKKAWIEVLKKNPNNLSDWVSLNANDRELITLEQHHTEWLTKTDRDILVWTPGVIRFLLIKEVEIIRLMILYQLDIKVFARCLDEIGDPILVHSIINFLSPHQDRNQLLKLLEKAPLAYKQSGEWTDSFVAIIACLEAYRHVQELLTKSKFIYDHENKTLVDIPALHKELDAFIQAFIKILSKRSDSLFLVLFLFDALSQEYHFEKQKKQDLLGYFPKDKFLDHLIDDFAQQNITIHDVLQALEKRLNFSEKTIYPQNNRNAIFKISFLVYATGLLVYKQQNNLITSSAEFQTDSKAVLLSFQQHVLSDYRLVSRFMIRYDDTVSDWLCKIFGALLSLQKNTSQSLQELWDYLSPTREQAAYSSDYYEQSRINYSAFVIYMGLYAAFIKNHETDATNKALCIWEQCFDMAYAFWLHANSIYSIASSSHLLEVCFPYAWKTLSTDFEHVCQKKLMGLSASPGVVLNILLLLHINQVPLTVIFNINPLSHSVLARAALKELEKLQGLSRRHYAYSNQPDIARFAEALINHFKHEGILCSTPNA